MAAEKETVAAEAAAPAEKKRSRKAKGADEAVKEPAAKKAAAKKADPKTNVVIEFAGKQIAAADTVKAAIKAYKKANRGVVIKKVDVYVKPEENAAYYVVNGEASPDYKIDL